MNTVDLLARQVCCSRLGHRGYRGGARAFLKAAGKRMLQQALHNAAVTIENVHLRYECASAADAEGLEPGTSGRVACQICAPHPSAPCCRRRWALNNRAAPRGVARWVLGKRRDRDRRWALQRNPQRGVTRPRRRRRWPHCTAGSLLLACCSPHNVLSPLRGCINILIAIGRSSA